MNTNVVMGRQLMPHQELRSLIARKPDWLILVEDNTHYLIDTRVLEKRMNQLERPEEERIDLLKLGVANAIATVDMQANLNEAWQIMLMTGNQAICVRSKHAFLLNANIGVITRKAMETHIYRRYGAKN